MSHLRRPTRVTSGVRAATAALLFVLVFLGVTTSAMAGVVVSGITADEEANNIVMGPDATSRAYPNEVVIPRDRPALFIGNQPITKTVNLVQISKLHTIADCHAPVFVELKVYRYPDGSTGPVAGGTLVAKSKFPTLVDNNQQQSRWLTEEPLDLQKGGSYGFVPTVTGDSFAIDPNNEEQVAQRQLCLTSLLRSTTYPAVDPPKPNDRACVPMNIRSYRPDHTIFEMYRVWMNAQTDSEQQISDGDPGTADAAAVSDICGNDRKVSATNGDGWWAFAKHGEEWVLPYLRQYATQNADHTPTIEEVKNQARAPMCEYYFNSLGMADWDYSVVDHVKGMWLDTPSLTGVFGAVAIHKCTWASFPPDDQDPDKSGWFWALPYGPGLPGPDGARQTGARQILDAELSSSVSAPGMTDPRENSGGENPSAEVPRCNTGDPINCATGNFYEEFTDLRLPGRGVGVSVTRTYNAKAAVPDAAGVAPPLGMFGRGWTSDFEARLIFSSPTTVVVQHGNGSTVPFAKVGNDWIAPDWGLSSLTRASATAPYVYKLPDRTTLTFSPTSGVLLQVADERNNRVSLSWTSGRLTKVSGGGRSISFAYTPEGRVSSATDSAGRVVNYVYSGTGTLTAVQDVGGEMTLFAYDSRGRMIRKTDPNDAVTRNVYDAQDRVTSQTDPAGRVTKLEYLGSPSGSKVKVTDRDGVVSMKLFNNFIPISETRGYGTSKAATVTMAHNERGQLRRLIDPLGRVTKYRYDDAGNQIEVEDALGGVTKTTFDSAKRPIQTVSPSGRRTTITYDAKGNVLSTVRDGTTAALTGRTETRFTYDAYGQVLTSTNDGGGITQFTYDDFGNQIKVVTPGGRVTTMTYDARGDLITKTLPAGNVAGATPSANQIVYTRNAYGAPLTVKDATGGTTTNDYDAVGNLASITDADGRATIFVYDLLGRKIEQTRGDGGKDKWSYTPEGQLLTRTDGNGFVWRNGYDELGRRTSETDPYSAVTTYEYDGSGALKRANAPDGSSVSYGYDALGRSIQVGANLPGTQVPLAPTTTYQYDADGFVTRANNRSEDSTMRWDALGRMDQRTYGNGDDARNNQGMTSLSYNSAGNLASVTYPTGVQHPTGSGSTRSTAFFGTVNYTYGADGEMTGAQGLSGGAYSFVYDANGNLSKANYPAGRSATYSRDAMGRITNIVTPAGTRGYSYTAAGVRKTYSLDGTSSVLTVDGAKHLKAFGTRTYTFDAAENPTRGYDAAGLAIKQTFYGPRITGLEEADGFRRQGFEFDQLGRRVKDTYGSSFGSYTWNEIGQLKQANFRTRAGGFSGVSFTYGPTGLRKTASRGVVSVEAWEEALGDNAPMLTQGLQAVVYGPGGMLLERVGANGANPVYQWQDAIGTVIGGTSAAGTTTKLTYDPLGRRVSGDETLVGSQGFAGQETEPGTNFQYMRARWYDPATGLFLTVDPKVQETGQPYLYAGGNSAQYSDPSGDSYAEDFTNGMIQGLSQGLLKPGSNEGSCTMAYFLGLQAGAGFSPLGRAGKLKELLGFAKGAKTAAGGAASQVLIRTERQLQSKFKHAGDFGVAGNYSKANAALFSEAINRHINAPSVLRITGTYRGERVIHYLDPATGLNVIADEAGNFISGWRLSSGQLRNILEHGGL